MAYLGLAISLAIVVGLVGLGILVFFWGAHDEAEADEKLRIRRERIEAMFGDHR